MIQFNEDQKSLYGTKAMDLANLSVVGLVFGTLVSGRINFLLIGVGIFLYFAFTIYSYKLTQ